MPVGVKALAGLGALKIIMQRKKHQRISISISDRVAIKRIYILLSKKSCGGHHTYYRSLLYFSFH
jgi:hypothetical protein